jgi:hypothetical protein
MTTNARIESGRIPTIEEFWAAFAKSREEREADRKEREADRKEWEARHEKSRAEWEARISETEKLIKAVSKNVGGLSNSLGELIETLIAARLWEKFSDYPYNLKRAYQRVPVFNENNETVTVIDILLSNTDWVMAVEVKRELRRKDDVDDHVRRMERIRKYPPLETVGKKLVGAMAGGVVVPDIRDYIHNAGFFVLELSGENVSLVKPTVEFTPREW